MATTASTGSVDEPLGLDRITDAALALVDREGASALTMRRVASELGVAPMSLYNHVADKAELQRAILERALAGLEYRQDEDLRASARRFAHDVRDRILAHPGTIGLLGTGTGAGQLLDSLQANYSDLTDRGVPGPIALRMIGSVARYVIGSLLAEILGPHATDKTRDEHDADFDFGLDALFDGFAVLLGVDPTTLPDEPPDT